MNPMSKKYNPIKKKRSSGSANNDEHISKWRYFKLRQFLIPTFGNTVKRKSDLQVNSGNQLHDVLNNWVLQCNSQPSMMLKQHDGANISRLPCQSHNLKLLGWLLHWRARVTRSSLLQRNRVMLRVIEYFAKSLEVILFKHFLTST